MSPSDPEAIDRDAEAVRVPAPPPAAQPDLDPRILAVIQEAPRFAYVKVRTEEIADIARVVANARNRDLTVIVSKDMTIPAIWVMR